MRTIMKHSEVDISLATSSINAGAPNTGPSKRRKTEQSQERKYYLMKPKAHATAPGWKLVNGAELFGDNSKILAPPSPLERGFRDYPVRPRFRVSTRLGRRLYDFQKNASYWMVSDRAKRILSDISESDFSFLALDTEVDPGQEPLVLWLCDVMPMLDAVDKARSKVQTVRRDDGTYGYNIIGDFSLIFDENVVGSHHVFRLRTNPSHIVYDETVKAAIQNNGLTGLRFRNAAAI